MSLIINKEERIAIWEHIRNRLEEHEDNIKRIRVSPILDKSSVIRIIAEHPFEECMSPIQAIDYVIDGLKNQLVHTTHPYYMGLFNPKSNFASVIGDLITAAFNPQMATWSHAPFPIDVENYMVSEIGKKLGFTKGVDGVFTSGGAEANLTAITCALNYSFPEIKKNGIRSLKGPPVLYCSSEAHHSVVRAAIVTGLGEAAVRGVPTDNQLKMDLKALEKYVVEDERAGKIPFCIICTAGTTGAGAIDDLVQIRSITDQYNLWMHTDAAYGGALALTDKYNSLLKGIEHSNSVTIDAHKWMSVPMGAGIFITKEQEILTQTFGISTDYMPKEGRQLNIVDPYAHSIQWSRRFIGLKLYLSLLVFGWDGYNQSIQEDVRIGKLLKQLLSDSGWKIYNQTELPIVCFGREEWESSPEKVFNVVNDIVAQGQMWVSSFKVKKNNTIRACITNYLTRDEEIHNIVKMINHYRT